MAYEDGTPEYQMNASASKETKAFVNGLYFEAARAVAGIQARKSMGIRAARYESLNGPWVNAKRKLEEALSFGVINIHDFTKLQTAESGFVNMTTPVSKEQSEEHLNSLAEAVKAKLEQSK
jgi:hypothetical protein